MLNVKDYINELEEAHPFLNKNIYMKCYHLDEINLLVQSYINNTLLAEARVPANSIMNYNPAEWVVNILMAFEQMLEQIMNKPFEEVLDIYYEQDASMEDLNEIAKLWNDTKNFNEWVQIRREELGIW